MLMHVLGSGGGLVLGCNAAGQCQNSQNMFINLMLIEHVGPLAQKVWTTHGFLEFVIVDA